MGHKLNKQAPGKQIAAVDSNIASTKKAFAPVTGYIFTSKNELDTAVNAWIGDNSTAITTYGDINTWNVSGITDMSTIFLNKDFNSDISNWDVSNVTITRDMFAYSNSFNQDISSWDVSNVTDMRGMFGNAPNFNQAIGTWDVSNVRYMTNMFNYATSFDKDLTSWFINKETNIFGMFENTDYKKSYNGQQFALHLKNRGFSDKQIKEANLIPPSS